MTSQRPVIVLYVGTSSLSYVPILSFEQNAFSRPSSGVFRRIGCTMNRVGALLGCGCPAGHAANARPLQPTTSARIASLSEKNVGGSRPTIGQRSKVHPFPDVSGESLLHPLCPRRWSVNVTLV